MADACAERIPGFALRTPSVGSRRQTEIAVIVVFDTTVLFTDVHASRRLTGQVLRGAASGTWHVVVPRVVVEEAVRQYPARLNAALDGSRRALHEFRTTFQALGLTASEAPDADVNTLVASYEVNLRAALSGEGSTIEEHPTQTEVVGTWAATRRRPFKPDGTGACDAFVWLTVLDAAEADDVIFVSANSKDFADPDDPTQLAPELRLDLDERGLEPKRVRRVDNVHKLLAELIVPAQQALERAGALLADPERRARLVAQISFDASWSPSEWDAIEDWNLGVEVEDFTLQAFDATDLQVESAEEAEDGTLTMLLHGVGTASLDFFVEKSEMLHAPEGSPVEVYDVDWNDWYAWAQASLPARAEIDVRVRPNDVFEITIDSVEPA